MPGNYTLATHKSHSSHKYIVAQGRRDELVERCRTSYLLHCKGDAWEVL